MKFMFSLLILLVLSKECEQKQVSQKTHNSDFTSVDKEQLQHTAQSDLSIIYEANTRGYFEKVWISKDSVKRTTDRSQKDIASFPCSKEDWSELMEALTEVKLPNLNELEVLSKKFQFDGAVMASLKVMDGDVIHSSPIFDHGNPPKPISEVVKKVLSINEKVKKQ